MKLSVFLRRCTIGIAGGCVVFLSVVHAAEEANQRFSALPKLEQCTTLKYQGLTLYYYVIVIDGQEYILIKDNQTAISLCPKLK